MDSSHKNYYLQVIPYAEKASSQLGIPAALITAWWSWETDFGTNGTTKVNNEAGISANSSGRDFVSGGYAGYNSMDSFVADYVRLLGDPDVEWKGYPEILRTAKRNPNDYAAITRAHNASKWSQADYNVNVIVSRANEVLQLEGNDVNQNHLPNVEGLSDTEMKKYATIGLAAVALVALIK